MHGFQFWINLPSHIKAEQPEYMAIQASEVPQRILPGNRGWIKIILGHYEQLKSSIPDYTAQFLYHIHLEGKQQLSVPFSEKTEVAAFLPTQNARLNDTEFTAGEFVEFDHEAGEIEIANTLREPIDILLFGGEHYDEPIVAQGPFVMNTQHEISQAYNDFYSGKYGRISYQKQA